MFKDWTKTKGYLSKVQLIILLILLILIMLLVSGCGLVEEIPLLSPEVDYSERDMDSLLSAGKIDPYFEEFSIQDLDLVSYKINKLDKNNCFLLSQKDFDKIKSDVVFGDVGECVRLKESINFNHTIIINSTNGFFLDCDGYEVTGNYNSSYFGIISMGNSIIKNCVVIKRAGNFLLMGDSKVYDSKAIGFFTHNGSWRPTGGFEVRDSSMVYNSVAENNQGGFSLEGTEIYNCSAINNSLGYQLFGEARIYDSLAEENREGYQTRHNAGIIDSIAKNNVYTGFQIGVGPGNQFAINCIAIGNPLGFFMGWEAVVSSSETQEGSVGFGVYENSIVRDSTALDSSQFGFDLNDFSIVENSFARGNYYGVLAKDSSILINMDSRQNIYRGLMARENSQILGGKFCDNHQVIPDISSQGAYFEGYIRTSTIEGNYTGNPTILPCKKVIPIGVHPMIAKFR
jgi:hypothetical protein